MRMQNNIRISNSALKYILFSFVIVLSVGYFMISLSNRYQNDDLGFSYGIRMYGIWNRFIMNALNWETNLNTLTLFCLLKSTSIFQPFVLNIFIFILDVFGFWLLLKTIIKYYSIGLEGMEIFLLSTLIICITYFSCRAEGNVTYWVTGQIVYCLVLFYLFVGLHFWINGKMFLACFFMFLFAHSRLNYDAIFIGLYFSFWGFQYYTNKKFLPNWKIHLPFLMFILGLITYIIIPGNFKRAASLNLNQTDQHLSIFSLINEWLHAFKHLIGIILTSWKQLIILPIGLIIGLCMNQHSQFKQLINIRFLFKCTIAFSISYIGQATVVLLAIGTPVGYGRIFLFLELLLFVLFLLYGFYFGFKLKEKIGEKVTNILCVVFTVLVLIPITLDYFQNFKIVGKFAKAYDHRINYLMTEKKVNTTTTVYLKPLPPSGVLQFMEILPLQSSSNELPYDNWVYVKYFDLPFNIYLKD